MDEKEMIEVAVIGKAQGIKGELKLNPINDAERLANYKTLSIGDREYEVEGFRTAQNGAFVKLKGVDDRNAAERLTKLPVMVEKALVPRAADEYFIVDLLGSEVFADGQRLGVLSDVLQTGAADVYCVSGGKPFMFPALKKVLKRIDIERKIIELEPNVLGEIVLYEE